MKNEFGVLTEEEFAHGLRALTHSLGSIDKAKAFVEMAAERRLQHRGAQATGEAVRDIVGWAKQNPEAAGGVGALFVAGMGALAFAARPRKAAQSAPGLDAAAAIDALQKPKGPSVESAQVAIATAAEAVDRVAMNILVNGIE